MSRQRFLWGMVGVLLVAAALRLLAFGQVPPGLYHDEAYHGLDALEVLQGDLALYFPANNGREPIFIYLVTLMTGLLGASPFAVRLAAFPVGLLTVAAMATMARVLFSRRVGLLSAAVLAVTLWHVHLSRVAFRAVLLPLFTALVIWQVARALRTGRRGPWLAAGFIYGLSFYTYNAARFTPVALAVFIVYLLATQPAVRGLRTSLWGGLSLAAAAALVAGAPLGVYALTHPDAVLGRPGQVSIFNPAIHGGDPWGTLGRHTLRTLGMFFVQGDRIWRHNVPWRPIFDPLLGAAFVVGLLVALRRGRRDPAAGFVLVWSAVMSLTTLLAEDAPHFLRAVGLLPVVALLPALGLDALWRRWRRPVGVAVTAGVLLFGLGSTTWAYFGSYARDPMTGYWFEEGAVALAGRVNEFLGVGWDGERMVRGDPGDRWVRVDPWLWEQWPQVRFLVTAEEALGVGVGEQPADAPTAFFVWPYGDWQRVWPLLPTPVEILVEEGPPSQGDLDPEPYTTYLAFFATQPDPDAPAVARFSQGVELLGVSVTPREDGHLRARLRWRATQLLDGDYTVFVHYLRDGERLAQADARPAGGHYPTARWRPGDVIVDDHDFEVIEPLAERDALLFGLWDPETGEKLYLLDEAGNPAGDWLVVPVELE
ncbi:MAG: glycosyltransferase family 39 protein [Anaerolineae bacterium]|jgi:4-amino-4-deoxy-L-arabinose transferase-like glycosyltransferase